jgi:ABC-type transport system involved in multi-copper enzyme maturation permease subunit
MRGIASLAGVLASMALLGALIRVVGIALLASVTARREATAMARAIGLFALASLVFVVAVVGIELAVSGAWIPGP